MRRDDDDPTLFDLPYRAPAMRQVRNSVAAANLVTERWARSAQARLIRVLGDAHPDAMTDEEMAEAADMNPSTQRPRRIELHGRGLIVAGGIGRTRAGREATLWELTDDGWAVLERLGWA